MKLEPQPACNGVRDKKRCTALEAPWRSRNYPTMHFCDACKPDCARVAAVLPKRSAASQPTT